MPVSASLHQLFHRIVPFVPPPPINPHKSNNTQSTSLIYGRLPPELRQMVWEWYFRQHAVHIHRVGKKWRARECLKKETWEASALAQRRGSSASLSASSNSDDDDDDDDDDRKGGSRRRKVTWGVVKGPHFGVCTRPGQMCDCVVLLLTCKRVYFETISYLYSETFFDFSHAPATITTIRTRPFAPYVPLISQINISWELFWPLLFSDLAPPHKHGKAEQLWLDVWDTLSKLEGLRFLRVEIEIARAHQAEEWAEVEWSILKRGPCKVRALEYFELVFPWEAIDGGRREKEEEGLPFVITRVDAVRQAQAQAS